MESALITKKLLEPWLNILIACTTLMLPLMLTFVILILGILCLRILLVFWIVLSLMRTLNQLFFSFSNGSSPGPDGYTAEFYKENWDLIGVKVCKVVKNFFSSSQMTKGAKATAITLIPKHSHANSISDYRPISLCNVFYKVVAKLLANRLKKVLPYIIHESQGGFIKDRSASDNIILASEILRDFNNSNNYFCAKLDIHKAFDSISRDFIICCLKNKGFTDKFIGWIKGCIYNVYFSICVNGSFEGFFNSSSGLRQGCPLSPLLFCIVMDNFSNRLMDKQKYNFKGYSSNGQEFNHLLYADDVLVFGKNSIQNAKNFKLIMEDFAKASALCFNPNKSTIIFSPRAGNTREICSILGISNMAESFTYLGIPISIKRLSASFFQPLLDKISGLLDGWKVKFLSMAGRIQFLKFSIANTLAYWIRGAIIPKSVCKFIDRICSRFLFHGNSNYKKMHLIAWTTVCSPKKAGGLGLPSINALYHSFTCSLIWRMLASNNALAVWYRGNYDSPWKPSPAGASKFWKLICSVARKIKSKLKLHITTNSSFSFYWDPWCNGMAIADIINPDCDIFVPVKNFIQDLNWRLSNDIPRIVKEEILKIDIGKQPSLDWDGLTKPINSKFLEDFYSDNPEISWHKYIWYKKNPLRFSIYSWMAIMGKLKTADILLKRNISTPIICSCCNNDHESHNHLFFECDYSFWVIKSLFPLMENFLMRPTLIQILEHLDLHQGFSNNVKKILLLGYLCSCLFHLDGEE
ncbi:hypothetical protein KFK09_005813 [Dendrobium nobile]|uniref:Reverse transcriptase domain-containing protein n=1 Tax=Dendrobium nobile TaxID=94219 RepID=A0A8T3C078_DENNO|nr:hypothetical protein KFK09_005813 [Dendrobium nobile]